MWNFIKSCQDLQFQYTIIKKKTKCSMKWDCLMYSALLWDRTLSNSCTIIYRKTADKPMESITELDWNTQPNLGEQEEPWQEFQEFQDREPIDQDKVPTVTCAEKDTWPFLFIPGENGTENPTSSRKNSLSLLQLLLPLSFLLSKPEAIESMKFLNFP